MRWLPITYTHGRSNIGASMGATVRQHRGWCISVGFRQRLQARLHARLWAASVAGKPTRQRFGFQWGLQQQLVAYISASIKTQGGYKSSPLPPSCKRPSKRLESLVSRPHPLESPFFRLDQISFRVQSGKTRLQQVGAVIPGFDRLFRLFHSCDVSGRGGGGRWVERNREAALCLALKCTWGLSKCPAGSRLSKPYLGGGSSECSRLPT